MEYFWGYLICINLAAFFLCALDKHRARRKKWRIPEATLFAVSLLGGSVGMYLAMLLFRHKTRHLSFMLGIPLIFLAQVALILFLFHII